MLAFPTFNVLRCPLQEIEYDPQLMDRNRILAHPNPFQPGDESSFDELLLSYSKM